MYKISSIYTFQANFQGHYIRPIYLDIHMNHILIQIYSDICPYQNFIHDNLEKFQANCKFSRPTVNFPGQLYTMLYQDWLTYCCHESVLNKFDHFSRWRSHSVNSLSSTCRGWKRNTKKSFLQLLFLKWDDKLMKQILHFVPILAFFLSCRHHPSHWWQHEGEVLMAGGARGWRRWVDFIAFCLFFLILTD